MTDFEHRLPLGTFLSDAGNLLPVVGDDATEVPFAAVANELAPVQTGGNRRREDIKALFAVLGAAAERGASPEPFMDAMEPPLSAIPEEDTAIRGFYVGQLATGGQQR